MPSSVTVGDYVYQYYPGHVADGATIKDYIGSGTDLTIPTSVTIDAIDYSVTTIGEQAFYSKSLTSVTIPTSVTTIGTYAFGLNSLTSVTIPSLVTTIGYAAFSRNKLTSLTIPTSVTTISAEAFWDNLLTSLTIPNSVTTISDGAFEWNFLTSVTIPNSVTTIGLSAFYNNLLTSVTIPNSVTTIGGNAFSYNLLTSVTIPTSVTTIGPSAFENNKLTSVTIPTSVTSIGAWAFSSNSLKSVTIPTSVTSIGNDAFAANPLESVAMLGPVPTTMGIQPFGFAGAATPMVTFNPTFTSSGYTTPTWTAGGQAYASGVAVGDYVYSYDSGNVAAGATVAGYVGSGTVLTIPGTVTIGPDNYSVTGIGEQAFYGKSLTSVTIPASVTTIGDYAFAYSSLDSVVMLGPVPTTIGILPFGVAGAAKPLVTFNSSFASSGYTTPTWTAGGQAYASQAVTAPSISGVSPSSGSSAGGTVVTLTGLAFTGVTSVTFGGVAGTGLSVSSATSLTVVAPAHAAGPVNVVVTTPLVSSAPATFRYVAVATVTSVSPGFGATVGGTSVTLTGTDLLGATQVTFGGVAGTSLNVVSDTSLTVVTPAGTLAQAPIVVTNAIGESLPAAPAFFAYTDSHVMAGIPSGIADVSNFTPGVVRCYQVTGVAGVPVGAVGVTLNVTASLPSAPGHVRVYPDYNNDGASVAPAVSTVNFEVNRDVANSTTISLPTDGKVCAYGVGGTMSRLILDVESYTLPGSGINLITPEKLIDTRSQPQYHVGSIAGPVEPMTDYTVQVTGVGSVPVGATAVMVNITAVDTNTPGHLRMWAADQSMPATSVVNYAPETKANSQIVALSADGKLKFRSFSYVPTSVSPVQILIDVTGYITAGSDFTATTPTTVVETRPSYTAVGLPGAPLNPNTIYPLHLTDTTLVPASATAVVLNVTVVQPTDFGHIRVYPDTNGLGTTPAPVMSNINFIPGRDIPNMVIVQLPPDRKIDFYTVFLGTGRTDLKVDLIGYISGPT